MEVNIVSDKLKGSLLLTLAAMIWGSSFIVMKSAVDFLTPNVLLFVRFSLATVIMVIMFYKHVKNTKLKDLKGGIVTGTCFKKTCTGHFCYLLRYIYQLCNTSNDTGRSGEGHGSDSNSRTAAGDQRQYGTGKVHPGAV